MNLFFFRNKLKNFLRCHAVHNKVVRSHGLFTEKYNLRYCVDKKLKKILDICGHQDYTSDIIRSDVAHCSLKKLIIEKLAKSS